MQRAHTFKVINIDVDITAVPLSVALWRVLKLHPKPIQIRASSISIKYFKVKLSWEEQVSSLSSEVTCRQKYPIIV